MSDVYTIDLEALDLDTDVIELPALAPVTRDRGSRGFRGRPGLDGESVKGEKGDSVKGDPGKDAAPIDPAQIERMVSDAVALSVSDAVARIPRPKDGEPGKPGRPGLFTVGEPGKPGRNGRDADPSLVDKLVRDAVARIPRPKDGRTVLGDKGEPGPNGWTPIPAIEESGRLKAFLKIVDWFGGAGEKPPTGYVTEDGLSDDKSKAINIRGPKGKAGEDGSSGGGRGRDGKSAYQIALDNGFVGTEAEWLESLQGSGSGSASNSIEAIADGTVNGHRAVRVTGSDKVALVDSTNAAQAGTVIGISTTAASDGQPVTVQVIGEIDEPTFNFTPGPVYFDDVGRLTQTVPTSGFTQQVAVALSTTVVVVQIGPPIVLN